MNPTKILLLSLLPMLLIGCSTSPTAPKEPVAKISLVSAERPASEYLAQAANESNLEQQQRLILLAAHAFINQGNSQSASKLLSSIKPNLVNVAELQAEHLYLSAQILELATNYNEALNQLVYPAHWQLADWQMLSYYQLKAHLAKLTNQPIEQIKYLTLSTHYLPAEQQDEINDNIWRTLHPIEKQTLLDFSQEQTNPIVAGWLQLAYITKHYAVDPNVLLQQLGDWQHLNSSHPASIKLPTELERALTTKPYQPKNIAVLLPLTGPTAQIANTVRLGIISHYLETPYQQRKLQFFDTTIDAVAAYQKAKEAGADFIIGPLLQPAVEKLQQIPTDKFIEPVPPLANSTASTTSLENQQVDILATSSNSDVDSIEPTELPSMATNEQQTNVIPQLFLNHIEQFSPHEDRYFFALSPAEEAADAATKLYSDGVAKPLLLASNDKIGHRMAQSFNSAWQELTDNEAEIHYYDAGDQMKVTVQRSLGVIDSKERISQIQHLLGDEIKADFRSRRDIDAIFMLSSNQDLSLLKPFIDVNFSISAKSVPLYSTSRGRIESQKKETSDELNNLNMSDMPWLLNSTFELQQIEQLWPQWSYSQKRLYTMGYDALELVSKLAQMRALPGYQLSTRSGTLSVTEDGIIQRQLSWGRYKQGILSPLD